MALQGRLANNGILGLCISIAMLAASCEHPRENPKHFVQDGDPKLRDVNGVLYFRNVLFSGTVYGVATKNDTLLLAEYRDGLEDGWSRECYGPNAPKEARLYDRGKREGMHQAWWPNGKLRFRYSYKNDLMEGLAEEWYESGQPYRTLRYEAGHEAGLQTVWNADGSLFANYVAKDGRQYGLTGVMNCINYLKDEDRTLEARSGSGKVGIR